MSLASALFGPKVGGVCFQSLRRKVGAPQVKKAPLMTDDMRAMI